jgi:hypothetical protein
MDYLWTSKNIYFLKFYKDHKRLTLEFVPDEKEAYKRCCILNYTRFERYWIIRRSGCLIALKDGSYIFISNRIYHFTLYPGDLIIRVVMGRDIENFAIMTRFSTYLFNRDTVFSLIDKNTNLPPDLQFNFVIDEHFYFDKIVLPVDYQIIHNGGLLRQIFKG